MNPGSTWNKKYGWRCSPNIAIVKYWGKYPGQFPASPSVSMTLKESVTETFVRFTQDERGVRLVFNGEPEPLFAQRIEKYFRTLTDVVPWLDGVGAVIESRNNFPHSAGIASSASAFGALALCVAEVHRDLGFLSEEQFYPFASNLARIGSGSAARSVFGGFTLWGETPGVIGSSDREATPLRNLHENFSDMRDLIVVVSDRKKSVSSSAGHALMEHHPFAGQRYSLARDRAAAMPAILRDGDIEAFSRITIAEGLSLHALMLTSDPPVNLLEPLSVEIIRLADRFRAETGLPLAYTLDAGPNVHLIFPGSMVGEMARFTAELLASHSGRIRLIEDRRGDGPQCLSFEKDD